MPDPAPDSSDAAARRGAAGDARADVAAAPRVADLSALLGELDALRTSLQTDLTLAAAALDAGAPDLAHELVAADADQLATVQESALSRLRDLDAVSDAPVGDAPVRAAAGLDLPAAAEPGDAQPTTPSPAVQHRRRTARGRRLLPAAVLASAAAATIAFVLLSAETAPPPQTVTMGTASAASAQLSDLVTRGADASALRAAASQLDDQLARLVADSGNNPDATALAVLMLQRSARVLAASGQRAALGDVLERNRQLELQWRAGLPAAAPQQPATDGTAGPGGATPLPASPQPGAAPPAETNPSAQPSPGAGILTSAAPRPASPTPLPASAPSAVTAPGVRLPPMTG